MVGRRRSTSSYLPLVAAFWLISSAVALPVVCLGPDEYGAVVSVTFVFVGYAVDAAGAVPYILAFCAVFAIFGAAWAVSLDDRLRPSWLWRLLALTALLLAGLAAGGVVWAYHDMLAGFWPGWDRFLNRCQCAAEITASQAPELLLARPEVVIAYYVAGWLLLEGSARWLRKGASRGEAVQPFG